MGISGATRPPVFLVQRCYHRAMTDDQLTDIIQRLRQGDALHIRCQDGWWGYRFRAGQLIHFTRYVHEDATDEEATDDELREQLARWDYERVLGWMSPAASP